MPHRFAPALAALSCLAACDALERDPDERICTTELRINFCVTVNGDTALPDSALLVRDFGTRADTLFGSALSDGSFRTGRCLPEADGPSTLRLFQGPRLLAEQPVPAIRTVDGCHSADTTIDITY